jgi:hypothetical protein
MWLMGRSWVTMGGWYHDIGKGMLTRDGYDMLKGETSERALIRRHLQHFMVVRVL